MSDLINSTALSLIAEGDTDAINNSNSNFEKTKLQMNIFLVEQARRELNTIVKYTQILDKLQDKYQQKVLEYLDDSQNEDIFLQSLPAFITHISKCIDRSNDIIKNILGNDKLMNVLYLDMSQNNTTVTADNNYIASNLSDPQSRQKVRSAVKDILFQIEQSNNE